MFITFGLDTADTPDKISEYVKYGADEFFAGFVPREWLEKYGWEICPNRRSLGGGYNYTQVSELRDIAKAIHDNGARLNLAINTHDNGRERLGYLHDMVETMEKFNPDGYIVADPALMFSLKEWGINRPLHLSTGVGCFSSEAIRFFCSQFNIRRVVIPRKITVNETRALINNLKDVNVEYEIMIFGYRCYFNDEDCHSVHSGVRRNLCGDMLLAPHVVSNLFPDNWKDVTQSLANVKISSAELTDPESPLNQFRKKIILNEQPDPVFKDLHNPQGLDSGVVRGLFQNCGLCAIKAFREMGVHALKVPLRGSQDFKLASLKIVHKVMTAENPTPDFCRAIINSPAYCDEEVNCYYDVPEAHPNR